jgi:hypothetical protein
MGRLGVAALAGLLLLPGCGDGAKGPDASDASLEAGEIERGPEEAGEGGGTGCFPDCINSLFAECVPQGSCVIEAGSNSVSKCYSNGVRAYGIPRDDVLGGYATTVTKSDGNTTCYSLHTAGLVSGEFNLIYMDSAGREVARIVLEGGERGRQGTGTCSGTAVTFAFNLDSPSCVDSSHGVFGERTGSSCTAGQCNPF